MMSAQMSKNEILTFLRSMPVMNIAVMNGDKPLSSVLLFALDDDFTFYFSTNKGSFKANALIKNPKISFSVWKNLAMLVQADGNATLVEDDLQDEIMDKIANSISKIDEFWPPLVSIGRGEYQLFKVKISWLRALKLSELSIKDRAPFTELRF